MSKRNLADEIKALKARGVFEVGLFNFTNLENIDKLLATFKNNPAIEIDEFYKYIPIACVTAIESFSRSAIKSLIDKGGIYFENLPSLIQTLSLKIDFDILANLQRQQFTLGEFISHLLPCNNLADVNRNFSIILGGDFFKKLKEYKPVIAGYFDEDENNKFNAEFDSLIKSVNQIFTLRHIYTHELPEINTINRSEFEDHYERIKYFLNYSGTFMASLIIDDWGMAVHEKVDKLEKIFEDEEKKLFDLMQLYYDNNILLTEDPVEFEKKFNTMIEAWVSFSTTKASLKGSYTPSGYWASIIFFEERLRDIKELTKTLQ